MKNRGLAPGEPALHQTHGEMKPLVLSAHEYVSVDENDEFKAEWTGTGHRQPGVLKRSSRILSSSCQRWLSRMDKSFFLTVCALIPTSLCTRHIGMPTTIRAKACTSNSIRT